VPAGSGAATEAAELRAFAASLGMAAKVALSATGHKGIIFVSREDHCFHDLALRWKAASFAG